MLKGIRVSCSPHISQRYSTRQVMVDVIIGLAPAFLFAVYYFRQYALILVSTCVLTCVLTEWICNLICKKQDSLGDLSAVVTGIILAFSVPPSLPWWSAVIGSVFAVAIGKMVFGGLGANIFNPAMVGRAFLTASFGMLMTTWTVPATIDAAMPAVSVASQIADARTQATPLAWSKEVIKHKADVRIVNGQIREMFFGEVGGCLGETSVLALIIGGIYLLIRKTISFHIPLAVLLSAGAFAAIAYFINPEANMLPMAHITGGGLLICAFFIATDPVTAPLTRRGMWLFGIGIGTITMLIRVVGEYPGGVMYSVLLMNAFTPLIDRLFKRIPAGGKPHV